MPVYQSVGTKCQVSSQWGGVGEGQMSGSSQWEDKCRSLAVGGQMPG